MSFPSETKELLQEGPRHAHRVMRQMIRKCQEERLGVFLVILYKLLSVLKKHGLFIATIWKAVAEIVHVTAKRSEGF